MWKTIDLFAQPTPFYLIPPFCHPPFIKNFSDHPTPLFLENLEDLIPPLLKKGGSHYAVMADYVTTCLRSP